MLRKVRITLAVLFFALLTLLFLDFTGTLHAWFGWMAKLQLLPAILALNVGVVVFLVLLTLVFGRIYCSVICPLGVMQDVFAWLGKKAKKHRYTYAPAKMWLRYGVLVVFVLSLVVGGGVVARLIAPYSAYGRIVSSILAPVYQWGNQLLAMLAERMDSYLFYETEVWLKSGLTLVIALATLLIVGVLAWRNGRTYCNTICPVGTVLGMLSRWSLFRPVIDTSKCNGCRLCEKNCKAACIDSHNHEIDYTRCVACMDCLHKCKRGAIGYRFALPKCDKVNDVGATKTGSRRAFLAGMAAVAASTALHAQKKKVDGGLAIIEDKIVPQRTTPIMPPGAISARHFAQHCTACQLCVSACPNNVLRPSSDLNRMMQPEMSYERGYCRPECTKCSQVCPTGAIRPLSVEEKSSRQIGRAVWIRKNCLAATKGVHCDNCAHHCPTGAIQMVPSVAGDEKSVRIPAINTERCIGCGACENLCPARPFSAIVVEGIVTQKIM